MNRAQEIYRRIIERGMAAIDEFISERTSEELFLDFKRSSDNGVSPRLSQIDRNNLAKAISGFGNSSGGVIVWGIDCSPDNFVDGADVARAKVPITNIQRFMANIQGAISGCTIPPHDKVECHALRIEDDLGYLITYIPESQNSPHQVVGKNQYYIRAGSDFFPAPHQVLAGMFGRRPQPHVYQMFTISPMRHNGNTLVAELGIMATNGGPGIARDLFITATAIDLIGENSRLSWQLMDQNWGGNIGFGRIIHIISNEGVRVPPQVFQTPLLLRLELQPPFTEKFTVKMTIGASESPVANFTLQNSPERIQECYEKYFRLLQAGELNRQSNHPLTQKLFNINEQTGENA